MHSLVLVRGKEPRAAKLIKVKFKIIFIEVIFHKISFQRGPFSLKLRVAYVPAGQAGSNFTVQDHQRELAYQEIVYDWNNYTKND